MNGLKTGVHHKISSSSWMESFCSDIYDGKSGITELNQRRNGVSTFKKE